MSDNTSITYNKKLPESQDYFFLRKEGIRMIQEMAGDIWTDYNEHDPGVTILEQLCYALTDIAYRSEIDIEKLLFSAGNDESVALSNGLFFPEEILPSHPSTYEDYRACFLDKFRDRISNIWFSKVEGSIEGLTNIYVQTEKEYEATDTTSTEDPLVLQIHKYYSSVRNLSEDVNEVILLKPQSLEISARIDIGDKDIPEEVIAELYFQLEGFFTPKVKWNSFESMKARGLDNTAIFDTSSWHSGFCEGSSNSGINPTYTLPSIHRLMVSVPGIRSVSELNIFKNGIKVNNELISIDKGYYAQFAESLTNKDLHVYKKQNRISYNPEMVQVHLRQKVEEYTRIHMFPSLKRKRFNEDYYEQLTYYSSVQNSFPINYGIGKNTLSGEAGIARLEQTRQLQSFLLFFDQILCNHLAQLKNIPVLFSHNSDKNHQTYFTRVPEEVPYFSDLTDGKTEHVLTEFSKENYQDRKNRILDHLLSRYGIQFMDSGEYNLEHIWGVSGSEEIKNVSIALKSILLKHTQLLSKLRFKAIDYFAPEQNIGTEFRENHNSYPFKRTIYYLLNLPLTSTMKFASLADHYAVFTPSPLPDAEREAIQKEKNGTKIFQTQQQDEGKVRFIFPEQKSLDELAQYGSLENSYKIELTEGRYSLIFRTPRVNMELGTFGSQDRAEKTRDKLVEKFTGLNFQSEGFHVLEHVLLRPFLESQYRLTFTVRKNRSNGVIKSVSSGHYEEQKSLTTEVILAGTVKENYEIAQVYGKYSIYLCDANRNRIMELDGSYSELDAKRWLDDLVSFFKDLDNNRYPNPPEINYELVRLKWPPDEFFTFKISLILPEWVPRFNDPDFQNMFRRILSQNLPAHIQVNLVRLSIADMGLFEKEYQEWLELRDYMFRKEKRYLLSDEKSRRKTNSEFQQSRIRLDKKSLYLIDQFLLN